MSDTPRLDEKAQNQDKTDAAEVTATPSGVSEHLVKMVATPMVPGRHT
jgi:hypothetical protein